MRALRLQLLAALCVATAVVGLVHGRADAAEVASGTLNSGATETARCSAKGFTDTSDRLFQKCYVSFDLGALAGTTTTSCTGSCVSEGAVYSSGVGFNLDGCSPVGSAVAIYYGPQSGTEFGNIPARAFVSESNCGASSGNFADVNSTQQTNIATAKTYQTVHLDFAVTQPATAARWNKLLWHGIGGTRAQAAEMAWPPDWFPGGSDAEMGPFCGATVTSSIDGDATARVFVGDSIDWTIDQTALKTGNIEVQYGDGQPYYLLMSEAVFVDPYETTTEVPPFKAPDPALAPPGKITGTVAPYYVRAGSINLRCYDQQLEVFQYTTVGAEEVLPAEQSPCEQAMVFWPEFLSLDVGDEQTWNVRHRTIGYAGTAAYIDVEYAVWDDGTRDTPGLLTALTWTAVLTDVVPGSDEAFTLTAAYEGTTRQFLLRCIDVKGTHYGGQWSSSQQLSSGESGDEQSCLDQSGIGLRPSSWVPGLMRMGSCVLHALFVPSSSAVDELQATATLASDRAPIAFLTQTGELVYESVNGAPASVTAHRDDEFAVVAANPEIDGWDEVSVSFADLDDDGTIATIRTVLGVLLWVGFAWSLWVLTRRMIAQ